MSDREIHILFVEDDKTLSFVTKDNLEEKNYKVTCCHDGESALKVFREQEFDLCLLDIMLPKVDGFTVAKTIREENQDIPILFLTAKSMKEDKIHGLKIGGDDYITKPFSIEELILRIEVFLKRSRVNNSEKKTKKVYELGSYSFDYENLMLTYKDETIKLTVKESELLRLFCENHNKILKREDILLRIWGSDDYFLGRSLDVFISKLRKHLEYDPGIKIDNIHGVGFKMIIVMSDEDASTMSNDSLLYTC